MSDIFISYAPDDWDKAKALAEFFTCKWPLEGELDFVGRDGKLIEKFVRLSNRNL